MNTRDSNAMRAGDGDRHQVVEVLRAALDQGRLTLSEYDERVATAYHATTYADLNALLEDLPKTEKGALALPTPTVAAWIGPAGAAGSPPAKVSQPQRRIPLALQILWMIWGSAVAINVVVWTIVTVTTGWTYPWPLWVAGPSGVALLAVTIGIDWIRQQRNQDG
jgi:hypothetical protein